MKYGIKRFNEDELAMMRAVVNLDQFDAKSIMIRKGDIEKPIYRNPNNSINWVPLRDTLLDDEMPKGKSMKAADRRQRTYHKHQQRERQYRNLGYPLERFSEADLGKMKEGVGMFPETQHQYTMYNRGEKKGEKPITTKQAISMMEHERWLDEQDAIAEYEEAERLFMMDEMESLMQEVCWLDGTLERANLRMRELMENMDDLATSINSMMSMKYDCLEKIEKMQEMLNK